MTKAEISYRVSEKARISNEAAADLVDATFEIMKAFLERGETVKISGFGNFAVKTKRERKGRNPQTGDEITIPGRKVLTFHASDIMKKSLNMEHKDTNRAGRAAISEEMIDQTLADSFPASDPPSWNMGEESSASDDSNEKGKNSQKR